MLIWITALIVWTIFVFAIGYAEGRIDEGLVNIDNLREILDTMNRR